MPNQKIIARRRRAAAIFNPHGSGGHTPRPKNTKRTLNETHAAFRRPELVEGAVPPLYLTPVFQPGSSHTPKNAKRTLNKTHATGVPPLYLTLTEVGDRPTTQIRKTNPIYTAADLWTTKNAKRTQSTTPPSKKHETNPIRVRPAVATGYCPPRRYCCDSAPRAGRAYQYAVLPQVGFCWRMIGSASFKPHCSSTTRMFSWNWKASLRWNE